MDNRFMGFDKLIDEEYKKEYERNSMDPTVIVNLALTTLDEVLAIIAHIKAQGSLTTDQIVALADKQDLANLDAIKTLIAS